MPLQLVDNLTIQSIVMDYVDDYVDRFPVACNIYVSFASLDVKRVSYFLRLSKPFTLTSFLCLFFDLRRTQLFLVTNTTTAT